MWFLSGLLGGFPLGCFSIACFIFRFLVFGLRCVIAYCVFLFFNCGYYFAFNFGCLGVVTWVLFCLCYYFWFRWVAFGLGVWYLPLVCMCFCLLHVVCFAIITLN